MNIGLVILIIFAILAAVMFIIVLVQNSANKRKAEYNMNKYKLSQKENKAKRHIAFLSFISTPFLRAEAAAPKTGQKQKFAVFFTHYYYTKFRTKVNRNQ